VQVRALATMRYHDNIVHYHQVKKSQQLKKKKERKEVHPFLHNSVGFERATELEF
jgi:hypothetical protein